MKKTRQVNEEEKRVANNESSEIFDIIKAGRRVKIKVYWQKNVNNLWQFVIRKRVM